MTTALFVTRLLPLCALVSVLAQGCPESTKTQPLPPPAHDTMVMVHAVKIKGDGFMGGSILLPRLDWLGNELQQEFPDLRMHFDVETKELQLWGPPSLVERVAERRKKLAAMGPLVLQELRLTDVDATEALTDLKASFPGVRMDVDPKESTLFILARRSQFPEILARIQWLRENAKSKCPLPESNGDG